jgi:hypothetical protein
MKETRATDFYRKIESYIFEKNGWYKKKKK